MGGLGCFLYSGVWCGVWQGTTIGVLQGLWNMVWELDDFFILGFGEVVKLYLLNLIKQFNRGFGRVFDRVLWGFMSSGKWVGAGVSNKEGVELVSLVQGYKLV